MKNPPCGNRVLISFETISILEKDAPIMKQTLRILEFNLTKGRADSLTNESPLTNKSLSFKGIEKSHLKILIDK